MGYGAYKINLPENPEAIVFVNGMVARDHAGFFWLWKNLLWIGSVTTQADGCLQAKAGICSPKEVIMVSYWHSENHLKDFFRGEAHRRMMQFVAKHPQSLGLYNETYRPWRSGTYVNEPHGMAALYAGS